ncbi:tetratricopeptide repeat protein [Aliarcobacter butzleri]|uniref:tetratricopeptide repeat protein n=1 Tax=Aliarcobacter butzleri TaxID=28197 RepID=UPI00263DE309|nr:tetratricopeptide repeat protein [Aliarcobacter butzleri]MDN5067549.1 tetratricopeptide repeat protein [Aliarcobacter butzleri]
MSSELNFEELQNKLKKVLNTNRFRFIFIFYPNENLREEIKNYICNNFTSSNQITLNLEDNTYQDIASILYENDKSFIFIDDFFAVLDNADLYNGFNQRRDKIASKNINLICFVNSNFKEKFFQSSIEYIPDLFEFKNAIFEIETKSDNNKLQLKEIQSISYSSLGGLTTQSKKEELQRLLLKLNDVENVVEKLNLFSQITTIYRDVGEFKKALEYQEKILKLEEENLEKNHPNLASTYNNISTIYHEMEELEKALEYQKKAIDLKEAILKKNYPDLAISYNNISMIYQDMGDLKKALEYQQKALEIREKFSEVGKSDLASSYNNISVIYKSIANLNKALEYQKKALKIFEEILEENHPDLATAYNNISIIYQKMGEYKKALEYQEKALIIRKEILGDYHPLVGSSYGNIATIYMDLKECLKVKEYILKAMEIWKSSEYHKKDFIVSLRILESIESNIKKEKKLNYKKKGKFCKDI